MSATDTEFEDVLEAAFWLFDARRKGYGAWKGMPQSDRDAFKQQYRAIAALLAKREGDHSGHAARRMT